ncbi:MAG: FAD-dependent monooxygenase [Gemmatimonadetes bacterium]|nr:FAD-dependent monooxygenase [Gemmatimonadota bacterium]
MTETDLRDIPRDWDVVVVGAGPAGSIAAVEASRYGRRVLLVDRQRFPRYKVCGGCLNGRALGELSAAGRLEMIRRRGAVALHTFTITTADRRFDLPLPTGLAISRPALDTSLATAAAEEGAVFVDGCKAKLLQMHDDACRLRLVQKEHDLTVSARIVLAADGLVRPTMRSVDDAKAYRSRSRIGAGVMVRDVEDVFPPGRIFMGVGRGGYCGVVRVEDQSLNVGSALDVDFVDECGGVGPASIALLQETQLPIPAALDDDVRWWGTPHLTRSHGRRSGHRLLALGDAAGYVEPFTGEGMAWALASGRAAAVLASRAIDRFDDGVAQQWERRHRATVASAQRRCRVIAETLRRPLLVSGLSQVLTRAPSLAAPLIKAMNQPTS